jgi:hypothetical protein
MSTATDGRVRLATLRAGRPIYRALHPTPLRRVVEHGPVARLRERLHVPFAAGDVLEVVAALSAAGVTAWLAGGWGLDALEGRQRGPHGDLDLVVPDAGLALALGVVSGLGFQRIREAATSVPGALLPRRVALQDPRGRVLDVHPIDPATWPQEAGLGDAFAIGEVAGRSVECLSREAQRAAYAWRQGPPAT